jgi:two-component system nitrogen regulation response regulator GlnG
LFREDLFHRLNVIRLRLPPLRERREDIPLLARHFLQKSAQELGTEPKRLSEAAVKHLATLPWSGNVRQLQNVCHWLTVMAPAQNVEIADLPPELLGEAPVRPADDWRAALERAARDALNQGRRGIMDELSKQFEKVLINAALRHTAGRRIEAANLLGLGRNTLTRKIQELGLLEEEGGE